MINYVKWSFIKYKLGNKYYLISKSTRYIDLEKVKSSLLYIEFFKLGQKGFRLLTENKQTSMWMIILHIKNELLLNINANNSLNTISSTDLESGVIAFSQVETEVRIPSLMAA